MAAELPPKSSNVLAQERTDWALSRTRLAAERTMMAVLRTGLSFISFGFTIYKFLQYVQEGSTNSHLRASAPRNMGLALMAVGLFVLVAGSWQHWAFLRQLGREADHKLPWSVSLTGALFLMGIGLVAFITLAIRIFI
jgi:uncharacterized membrane protein YidH (DUF202 family)